MVGTCVMKPPIIKDDPSCMCSAVAGNAIERTIHVLSHSRGRPVSKQIGEAIPQLLDYVRLDLRGLHLP